jgi:hypothetical protein
MTNAAAPTVEILGHVLHDEPIADCGYCAQTGLRRLVKVRIDGVETSIGVNCGAKLTGTTQSVVKARATKADKDREHAIRDVWVAWNTAKYNVVTQSLRGRIIPIPDDWRRAREAEAAWIATHPEPTKPNR